MVEGGRHGGRVQVGEVERGIVLGTRDGSGGIAVGGAFGRRAAATFRGGD